MSSDAEARGDDLRNARTGEPHDGVRHPDFPPASWNEHPVQARGMVPQRPPARRGILFVVSAPSGTGKTTVVERLVHILPDLALSRSYTSRAARDGEHDGVDYNFVSRSRFEEMVAADAFLEWADVFGNL